MRIPHKHLLIAGLAAAMIPAVSQAQTRTPGGFDDRWYLTAGVGANQQDSSRDTENAAFATVGVGKFINPNWSVDLEVNYQNPKANRDEDLNFSQYGISLDARRHFRREGRMINPYIVGGIGYQRAEEEFDNFPNPNSPGQVERGYATAKLGVGAQADFQRVSARAEIAARHSFDDDSVVNPDESGFTDMLASVSVLVPLGAAPAAVVVPAPQVPAASCADIDSDGDGLDNCVDQCPESQAGQVVGTDGCPVAITIDLGDIHFDFDRSTLRSDARAILDDAVGILHRYPQMRVEVAGHTDECGSDGYNQGLSQRRAQAVYDYLLARDIDRARLAGPTGYGESQPLQPTGDTYPQCRNETNRRTELNVQN